MFVSFNLVIEDGYYVELQEFYDELSDAIDFLSRSENSDREVVFEIVVKNDDKNGLL